MSEIEKLYGSTPRHSQVALYEQERCSDVMKRKRIEALEEKIRKLEDSMFKLALAYGKHLKEYHQCQE